ncbi:hypothetical protein [Hahella ganghwensis]|uniref:hypothetical protein n=1 Tax=Hahella ganghwensis TaxID=286420 RepID=UPI000364C6D4|nr:hypothetical protein [Hahella ganghwensis]
MNNEESIEIIENDVLAVGVSGWDGGYFMWQRGLTEETGASDGIYFEFDDQSNGGFNIVKECTITNDGMHVLLSNRSLAHLYFPKGFTRFKELKDSLLKMYQGSEHVLAFNI